MIYLLCRDSFDNRFSKIDFVEIKNTNVTAISELIQLASKTER